MNENQFLLIRTKIFDDIRKLSINKKILEAKIDYLKQNQKASLNRYENFDDTLENNAAYQYTLENYNLSIKEKEFEEKCCTTAITCAQAYFNCIIAIAKEDEEFYDLKVEEYTELIQTEAMNRYDLEISMLKQKKVTDSKIKKYMTYLDPAAIGKFTSNSKNLLTQEQLTTINFRQLELEQEKIEAEKTFDTREPVINKMDFLLMKLYDSNPIELAKTIYPTFKNRVLEAQESQGKRASA